MNTFEVTCFFGGGEGEKESGAFLNESAKVSMLVWLNI